MSPLRTIVLHCAYSLFAVLTLAACAEGRGDPLALSAPASLTVAPEQVHANKVALPFKGTIVATETNEIDFDAMINHIHITGSGTATHLGRFTLVSDLDLDLNTFAGVERATFTAANGDLLTATVLAQGTETVPGETITTVERATITGGTGRFEGASGSYVLTRVLSETTGASRGEFTGTIHLAH